MRLGKGPGGLRLEEYASARSNEILMKHPLMKTALPPAPVQRVERLPAGLHPREAALGLAPAPHVQIPLQRVLPAAVPA